MTNALHDPRPLQPPAIIYLATQRRLSGRLVCIFMVHQHKAQAYVSLLVYNMCATMCACATLAQTTSPRRMLYHGAHRD